MQNIVEIMWKITQVQYTQFSCGHEAKLKEWYLRPKQPQKCLRHLTFFMVGACPQIPLTGASCALQSVPMMCWLVVAIAII